MEKFPPKPGTISPRARYCFPRGPVRFPGSPVPLPPLPGIQSAFLPGFEGRGNEAIEPSPKARYPVRINASWNSRSPVEILAGENGNWSLGQMQTAGYPFPDHLQTSNGAINVALESGIRGRQCLDTRKGGVMPHCLRLSTRCGAHEATMKFVIARTGTGRFPRSSPEARYLCIWGTKTSPAARYPQSWVSPKARYCCFRPAVCSLRGRIGSLV
jgi:hypothetical protein